MKVVRTTTHGYFKTGHTFKMSVTKYVNSQHRKENCLSNLYMGVLNSEHELHIVQIKRYFSEEIPLVAPVAKAHFLLTLCVDFLSSDTMKHTPSNLQAYVLNHESREERFILNVSFQIRAEKCSELKTKPLH